MAPGLSKLFSSRKSKSPSPLLPPHQSTPVSSYEDCPQSFAPQDQPAQTLQTISGPAQTSINVHPLPVTIRKGHNYGVTVLHDGGQDASVDIVFVHGLTGNAYNTWLHEDSKVHWPRDLLKHEIPRSRVVTFGYDADIVNFWNPASKSRLSNHAENMVGDLVRRRERTDTEARPIIFVAHSLGGLVVEHALSHSKNAAETHLHQIERCTAGIVFLGVPHCGSDLSAWLGFGTRMASLLRPTNRDIETVLKPGSEMLLLVENNFYSIIRQRQEEGSKIMITCFYEELPVTGLGEIVPLHSAVIKGHSHYGIHANHMDMTKFSHLEDPGYDAILGEILRWVKSANVQDNTATAIPGTAVQGKTNDIIFNPTLGTQSVSNDTGQKHWMVPRAVSTQYIGRRELGERLTQAFSYDSSNPPTKQRIFVIIGLGGTGKSEVCLRFAEDHRDEYWGVFWLDAKSDDTSNVKSNASIEQGLSDIGRSCGVAEPNLANVMSWLACNSHRWLLVIDNADDPRIDLSPYIPSSRSGDILITTRNPECDQHETVGSETLGSLGPELAQELLFRTANVPKYDWEEKKEAAMTVVHALELHTLAIIQAGAYVKKKLCTLEEYPTIFLQQKDQLLRFNSTQKMSTYGNVFSTFEVSAKYLERSPEPKASDALDLLHTFAFMHNSGISESFFQRASEYAFKLRDNDATNDKKTLSLSTRHLVEMPPYIVQRWSSSQGRQRWRIACSVLESLSIITTIEGRDLWTISAHSLVHSWAKERQSLQSRCRAWRSAASILALSSQPHYCYDHDNLVQSHIRACMSRDNENYMLNLSEKETVPILTQFAYVVDHVFDWKELDSILQRIRSTLEDRGLEQDDLRELEYFTARIALCKGNYQKAVDKFKEVVRIRSGMLTEDDDWLLEAQEKLAFAYIQNNQADEAITLLEHVMDMRANLREGHLSPLSIQKDLACAYRENGRTGEAVKMLEHVVKILEDLNESDPSRLTSQHELGRAYLENEQINEAVKMLEHVVKTRENLDESHPNRLASQHELGRAYLENEQIDEAVKMFEHVVEMREITLAEDHHSRLTSQDVLGCAYLANKQIDEAVEILEHVVKIREITLAEDHPQRLTSQHELGRAYLENEQFDEAVEILEHVVKIKEIKLTEDHPHRITSQHVLGRAYLANKQFDEAVKMLEHVIKIRSISLIEDHPNRLTLQHWLAIAYEARGQYEEARKLLEHVVKIDSEKRAEDDPDRILSQRALARVKRLCSDDMDSTGLEL